MKFLLAAAVLLCLAHSALAQCCCDHCGCQDNCHKVCRLVCETKKVTKPVYDCECEDFCVPGPSLCSIECDECGHKKQVYTPQCGTVRTRVKLIRKDETQEKVVYKWVVENVCCHCAQKAGIPAESRPPVAALPHQGVASGQLISFQPPVERRMSEAADQEESHALRSKFDVRRLFAPLVGGD